MQSWRSLSGFSVLIGRAQLWAIDPWMPHRKLLDAAGCCPMLDNNIHGLHFKVTDWQVKFCADFCFSRSKLVDISNFRQLRSTFSSFYAKESSKFWFLRSKFLIFGSQGQHFLVFMFKICHNFGKRLNFCQHFGC